jgi:hypothetical protein
MKNPQLVALVQQANIANGPQQVNNESFDASTRAPSRGGNLEIQQNRLLGQQHGKRLDFGARSHAVGSDAAMATVGALDGSKDPQR